MRRSTFVRYLSFQIPGWLLLLALMFLVRLWLDVPPWLIGTLLALWMAKDLALYPFLRRAYEDGPPAGAASLTGRRGVAATPLAPGGYVRVRGELWRAELIERKAQVPEGSPVRITGARGLTLRVEVVLDREDGPAAPRR